MLDEPVRIHPPLADPLREQRAALSVPRVTAVEIAWIAAVGRARSNLADMIGPDPVTAAEARADTLRDWPRHTHRMLADKSAAECQRILNSGSGTVSVMGPGSPPPLT